MHSFSAPELPNTQTRNTELLPKFAQVNDHAFLADDTLIGSYELGGGFADECAVEQLQAST